MARTIAEIKKEMTDAFLQDKTIQTLYGVVSNQSFESQFSKVSLESIIFYIVATCVWTLETLFDRHHQEVTGLIDNLRPHTLLWYINKTKAFQSECALKPDSDLYDNTGLTEDDIAKKCIVKYAAAEEKNGIVYIKVATGEKGKRTPLSEVEEEALTSYLKKVKDAGIKLKIVNEPADKFGIEIDIYYDPQILHGDDLYLISTNKQPVHDTIASFVENLPFNGEYYNSSLINALLAVEGVILVDLKQATANGEPITAKRVPAPGYFQVDKNALKIKAFPYDTASN